MNPIDALVKKTAAEIKAILMEQISRLQRFPYMSFGLGNREATSLSDPKLIALIEESKIWGIEARLQGIPIIQENEGEFLQWYTLAMTPTGLFRFSHGSYHWIDHGMITNSLHDLPSWGSRQELPLYYVLNGGSAYSKIQDVLKDQGVIRK